MKAASVFLLAATVSTGFLGGIGFVNFMGFGPALKNTPAEPLIKLTGIKAIFNSTM